MPLYNTAEVMTWDLETASDVDLKERGSEYYARHESTRILLFLYRLPGLAPACWDVASGKPMPPMLRACLENDDVIKRGANSMRFDTAVLRETQGIEVSYEVQEDVLIRAARYGLPTKLDALAKVMGANDDEQKDAAGKKLIGLFCKPLAANSRWRKQGYTYACADTHPDEWEKFIAYGLQDLVATDFTAERLPTWNDTEFEDRVLWLDMEINNRGIQIDRQYVDNAVAFYEDAKAAVIKEIERLTHGIRPAQHAKFKKWLQRQMPGRPIKSTAKDQLQILRDEGDLPPVVEQVLNLSGMTTSTSLSKFASMANYACANDRMYGVIRIYGAGVTGRWAGSGPQPHNYPRPNHKKWVIDLFIQLCRVGRAAELHHALKIAVSSLRGAMVPANDCIFVNADYSSIEGRLLGWVTGEQWVIDAYRDDKNLYLMNGELFGHDYATMKRFKESSDPVEYNIYMLCKVTELALGYQGGVGAFVSMAKNYGLDCAELANMLHEHDLVPEMYLKQAHRLYNNPRFRRQVKATGLDKKTWVYMDAVKRLWRARRPATVSFWKQIDECVRAALNCSELGTVFTCGWQGLIGVEFDGTYLGIRLPSGRILTYLWPKISGARPNADVDDPEGEDEDAEKEYNADDTIISYYSWTNKGLQKTYVHGGKFCNNIVQAIARDIMAHGLLTLDERGWPVVLHIHDQALAEVKREMMDYYTPKRMEADLCVMPSWAIGVPMKAEGEYLERFAK